MDINRQLYTCRCQFKSLRDMLPADNLVTASTDDKSVGDDVTVLDFQFIYTL